MTCTVTNTITRPGGAPWDNDTVAVSIAGPGFLSGSQQLIGQSQALTDNAGAVSFPLPPNNTGELYVWTNPDGKHYPFQVTATSGTIPLKQLLVTQDVPEGVIAATQAAMQDYVTARIGQLVPFASLADPQYAGGLLTSNTAARNGSVLTAALASGAKVLVAPQGTFQVTGHFTFGDVDLVGMGGGFGYSTTKFVFAAAGDRFEFSQGGGHSRDFCITGSTIATLPFARTGGVGGSGRSFTGITVGQSAQDVAYFEASQNDVFTQCDFRDAARDIAWFDGGYGGSQFNRCEFADAGRYHIRFDVTVDNTAYGDYPFPADLAFRDCILEGTAGTSQVYMVNGFNITFDGTDFYTVGIPTGPLVDIVSGVGISIGNFHAQCGNGPSYTAGTRFLRVGGNSVVNLFGHADYYFFETCIEPTSVTCLVDDKTHDFRNACGNKWFPSGTANYYTKGTFLPNGINVDNQYDGMPVLASFAYLRSALRFSVQNDGSLQWYPASSFTPDAQIGRKGAATAGPTQGSWSITGGTTAQRPSSPVTFTQFFDTTLHKQVTWDGAAWRDGSGTSV